MLNLNAKKARLPQSSGLLFKLVCMFVFFLPLTGKFYNHNDIFLKNLSFIVIILETNLTERLRNVD